MKKFREFLMNDVTFIILMVMISAGVMASTNLFVTDGVGAMASVSLITMLEAGVESGDWAVLIGFSGGFLLARVLEGPLVGILDIGGSIMAGVGFGMFGLIASTGFGSTILTSFTFALAAGAIVGLGLGLIIMGIRKFIPSGVTAGGTDIMMGVGHQMGAWLPPLILISALQANMIMGIAAAAGGAISFLRGKGMMGGIILGMFVAAFFVPIAA